MIKLKKQNISYREKILSMKSLINEGIRENIDLEAQLNLKNSACNSKKVQYMV
jgi:hypothetical protein